jgi:hypothetical protein
MSEGEDECTKKLSNKKKERTIEERKYEYKEKKMRARNGNFKRKLRRDFNIVLIVISKFF